MATKEKNENGKKNNVVDLPSGKKTENSEKDKKKLPEIKKYKKSVHMQYDFNPAEIKDQGAQLARANRKIEQKKLQQKEVAASINAEITKITAEIQKLATNIENGYDYRNIDCEVVKDFKKLKIVVTRFDTKKEIENRDMSFKESQQNFLV